MSPEDKQMLQDIWKQLVATDRSLNNKIDTLASRIGTVEAKLDNHIAYSKAMFRHLSGQIAESNVDVRQLDERVKRIEDRPGLEPDSGA